MGLSQGRFASGSCQNTNGPDAATIVVFGDPGVEIGLQLVNRVIDLLAERDPVKLVQHGAMEALADSIIRHDEFGAQVSALARRSGLW